MGVRRYVPRLRAPAVPLFTASSDSVSNPLDGRALAATVLALQYLVQQW